MFTEERKRILVVDDEPDVADLLRFYPERSGYEVLVAHGGIETFAVARKESPHHMTLDILLPDSDGSAVREG